METRYKRSPKRDFVSSFCRSRVKAQLPRLRRGIATHEHDSRGFNGDVGSRADRDSYARSRQRRRVVHAVAHIATILPRPESALLLTPCQRGAPRCDFIDSETPRD